MTAWALVLVALAAWAVVSVAFGFALAPTLHRLNDPSARPVRVEGDDLARAA